MDVLLVIAGALATALPTFFIGRDRFRKQREADSREELKAAFVRFFGIVSSIEWLSLTLYQRRLMGESQGHGAGAAPDARVFEDVSKAFLDPVRYEKGPIRQCVKRIDGLRDDLTAVYQELKLVAPVELSGKAADVIRALNRLVDTAAEDTSRIGIEAVEQQREAMSDAKQDLRDHVRPLLGTLPLEPSDRDWRRLGIGPGGRRRTRRDGVESTDVGIT